MNYQQKLKLNAWLRRPILTYLFLAIQTIVFAMMEFFPFLNIPAYLGMFGPSIVVGNEWWRFITPIFIHFGLVHFVMNSLILYFMGDQIETLYGHWRFFLIYLFSGILGNAASFAFNDLGVAYRKYHRPTTESDQLLDSSKNPIYACFWISFDNMCFIGFKKLRITCIM